MSRAVRIALMAGVLHPALLLAPRLLVEEPTAATPRGFALVALLALWSFAEMWAAPESRCVRGRAAALPPAIAGSLLLTLWLALLGVRSGPRGLVAGAAAVGGTLVVTGAALRVAAIRALGPRFLDAIALMPDHRIETRGIYGVLRHPSETGTLALSLGAACLTLSPLSLLAWAGLLVPLVAWRVRLEDAVLAAHDPELFSRHRATVPALLPLRLSRQRPADG